MAMDVIKNQNEGLALIRFTSNGTMEVANLATSNTETVSSVTITKLLFSGSNTWTVARGSNTVITLTGTGEFNLSALGWVLGESPSANLVITNPAATPGTLLIEVKKSGSVVYN